MPYVTEELWQRLPLRTSMNDCASIMIASYPTEESEWFNPAIEQSMEIVNSAISGAR
jgi:valyl-tRNA synthetase